MRRQYRHQQVEEDPAVNLTPLIDVVFVILIMFMIVAPMLEMDKVELANAPDRQQPVQVEQDSPITIHVRPDNTIWINSQFVNPELLSTILRTMKREHPDAKPQVFHDRQAYFGTYQHVKNAAESAGFEEIDLVLKPS